ncbi:MAG TPA: hydrogenase expression/formation protein HypE [Vicinamibacterales bacterium]|nr:hydrogenase expression/formation protein HypE [Vicinamibacterales bacterium]
MAPTTTVGRIAMRHGAGGRSMRRLIEEVLLDRGSRAATALDDGAVLPVGNGFLILTTDSHVIQPLVFPGGDIGRLSICGTVNDLAMMGATEPLGLTCALVIEEGFVLEDLARVRESMAAACREAQAPIVTGDTKVMGRGEVDGLVINTSGVALVDHVVRDSGLRPGDRVLLTGTIGDHGMAVMAARHQLDLGATLQSDVAPLNGLVRAALRVARGAVTAMKDPTRGGLASTLHEMAEKSGVGIRLDEQAIPIRTEVRAAAELLGIDPLLIANEGKAVLGVRPDAAAAVLAALRAHPLGREAAVIGVCSADLPGSIVLDTGFGRRLLPEPDGELLPRIC